MKIKSQLVFATFLISIGGYTQVQNNGNFRMLNGANMAILGNFTNNGTFTNNQGTLYAVGTNPQTFNGSNVIHTNDFTINKAADSLQLDNELQVSGILTFTNGRICSDHADKATEFVHFLDGATYLNVSDTSHVDGVVRKTGDDVFSFPVGDDNNHQPISINEPDLVTDSFTAEYFELDADPLYDEDLKEVTIDHISSCEYWILDRTNGNSDVNVTLGWDANSCGVNDLNDLLVARWDGTEWKNHGNGWTTGNSTSGTITTFGTVSSFSPFTLASTSSNNPLPIEMTYFRAEMIDQEVVLKWETRSEINNDYFTIERSNDGINFESLTVIDGAGNSNVTLNYLTLDKSPMYGVSYYRLKQTDFDGYSKYSQIISISINIFESEGQLTIHPNPAVNEFFNLKVPVIREYFTVHILNDNGRVVYSEVVYSSGNQIIPIYSSEQLLSGHYIVQLINEEEFWTSHLVIQ